MKLFYQVEATAENSDYDMADLFGKRMVVGDELSRDREFNESLLKKLTGGDEIKARQP